MNGRQLGLALLRGWWILLIGLVAGSAVAAAGTLLTRPTYTSSTQLFVSTTGGTSVADISQGSAFAEQRVASYALLLTGPQLAERVRNKLHLTTPSNALAREISASAVTGTVLIDVTVTDTSAARAARIATAVGSEFSLMAEDLEAPSSTGRSPVRVSVTQQASVPLEPTSPDPKSNLVLGAVIGLLVGASVAVARRQLSRTVGDAEDALLAAAAPIIGVIPLDDALRSSSPIVEAPEGPAAEAFRRLQLNLQFIDVDSPPRSILVTSAMPNEGKTTTSIHLAATLARSGKRVVLVDADLRRPDVARRLGLVDGIGLTDVLTGSTSSDAALVEFGSNLRVLGTGPIPPNPGQLLASDHMLSLVRDLEQSNDIVILDTAPLLPVADTSGLAPLVDGSIIVARTRSTRRERLEEAAALIRQVNARVLGVVVGHAAVEPEAGYAYRYRPTQES